MYSDDFGQQVWNLEVLTIIPMAQN